MGISFRCDDYMYSYAAAKPPGLATHSHKYYEFLIFLSGNASYMVESSSYKAESGDVFVTRPGELHTVSFNSDEPYERHFIQVSREWIEKIPYDLLSGIDRLNYGENNRIPSWLAEEYNLKDFFENIHYYMENKVPESEVMIRTYIIQFIAKVNTIMLKEPINEESENKLIASIKEYINNNFVNGISLDELAGHFYMNKYHMCHIFKEETGLTIKEFVNTRRIAKAKQLLPRYKSVKNLYAACGFSDYSTFYKTFKRFTGVSPTKFLN